MTTGGILCALLVSSIILTFLPLHHLKPQNNDDIYVDIQTRYFFSENQSLKQSNFGFYVIDNLLCNRHKQGTSNRKQTTYLHSRSFKSIAFCLLLLISGDVEVNPGPVNISSADHQQGRSQNVELGSAKISLPSSSSFDFSFPRKGLTLCHLNIRSITNKVDQVKMLLNDSITLNKNNRFIFAVTETHLDSSWSSESLTVNTFTLVRKDRETIHGGGILVYVPRSLSFKRRSDIEMLIHSRTESICLEFCPPNSRPFLTLFLYRPPDCDISFFDDLDAILESIEHENKETILTGDININLLETSSESKRLLQATRSFGFHQCISQITRPVSGTLIDHVFCNNRSNILKSGTLNYTISDHLPVYLTRKHKGGHEKKTAHTTITYRSRKDFNVDNFRADLQSAPFLSISSSCESLDDAVDLWNSLFLEVLNLHAPIKSRRVKRKTQPDWFNSEIREGIAKREQCYLTWRLSKDPDNWNSYKYWRNKVVHMINYAKKQYYHSVVRNNFKDASKLWKLVKHLAPTESNYQPDYLLTDGHKYDTPREIANHFNDHFSNIVNNFIQNFNRDLLPDLSALKQFISSKLQSESIFNLPLITTEFVIEFLNNIDIKKASGHDSISPFFLKAGAPAIADSITYLCNLSITSGIFPSQWKIAKILPLFKSDEITDRNNFRPISLLPILSKILEKHIFTSFYKFLTTHSLLYPQQFGFRENHSCELALIHLLDKLYEAMDKGNFSALLFLDMRKAFDLVDHGILIAKLKLYGLSPHALAWFSSYLDHRSQFVVFKGVKSELLPIKTGVPQGSILGPLLFLIFINDLPLLVQKSDIYLFADDSTLSSSGTTVSSVRQKIHFDSQIINDWANNNKMVLHCGKTKSMLITSKPKLAKFDCNLRISINDCDIEQVSSAKLLGVYLDSTLSWEKHIIHLCSIISSRIALLNRLAKFVPCRLLRMVYNALIFPYFIYCCTVWGSCSNSNLTKLLRLQKRAGRIILGVDRNFSSVALFKKLRWLPIFDLIKLRKLSIVHKIILNKAPSNIASLLTYSKTITSRSTRSSETDFFARRVRTSFGLKKFSYNSAILFNSLPSKIKSSANGLNLTVFKNTLLKYFSSKLNEVDRLENLMCTECKTSFLKASCTCIDNR